MEWQLLVVQAMLNVIQVEYLLVLYLCFAVVVLFFVLLHFLEDKGNDGGAFDRNIIGINSYTAIAIIDTLLEKLAT